MTPAALKEEETVAMRRPWEVRMGVVDKEAPVDVRCEKKSIIWPVDKPLLNTSFAFFPTSANTHGGPSPP